MYSLHDAPVAVVADLALLSELRDAATNIPPVNAHLSVSTSIRFVEPLVQLRPSVVIQYSPEYSMTK